MGLDITVLMVDWEHLARIPADDRVKVLGDAACPDFCCEVCEDADYAVTGGWVWQRQVSWCAEYRFHGTTGSYAWHPRLGNVWEDVRTSVAPELRDALDHFLRGLFWEDPDDLTGTDPTAVAKEERPAARGFPDDPAAWRPRVLLLSAPDEVSELVRRPPAGRAGPPASTPPQRCCANGATWPRRPAPGNGAWSVFPSRPDAV
ncbi:hypothetical protein [Streptomyces sp. XY332]|uniref:hypothetical protein n=1 Tax=Streptomyces sp. XY332 TaxID=1415561 RepID=UPI0006B16082|nr:hypothetical protein [Streptomyces sp. XY332]